MKKSRRTLLGLALFGGMSHLLAAPKAAPGALQRLDGELAAIASDPACLLASLSVVAVRDGKVAYKQQFGQQTIGTGGAPSKPATARTMYRIASISKMMTTLVVMMLVEEGKLDLTADVSNYLGFPLRNPHFPERVISLRDLLTHTSSLRDDAGYFWTADKALKDILVPGAALYGKGEMWASNAVPGAYFTYSNLNWGVIGTLMERVTGERFDQLMQRRLLAPLGLHGGFNPAAFSPEDLSNLATLYRKRTVDTEVWDPAGPWIAQNDDLSQRAPALPPNYERYVIGTNATPVSPTGGLRICAEDMAKVMLMLINGGKHEGRQLLKPATLARMFTREWTYDGSNGDTSHGQLKAWGLGNQQFFEPVVDVPGFNAVGHHGDAYGLTSVFVVDLAKKNGMVMLVGGTSTDFELYRGSYSAQTRYEERALSAIYRRAILGKAD
ncbi:MAG: serine hydrolase [Pseudomonadota bacterium]